MLNIRRFPWSMAMREIRGERVPRAGIREERLRSTAGIRSSAGLSSWRGASGRRYVVGIHTLAASVAEDLADGVMIAVRRGEDGTASVVDVVTPERGTTRRSRLRWLALVRTRGATEMHVHLLAEDEAEREAVRRDLAAADETAGEATVRKAAPRSPRAPGR